MRVVLGLSLTATSAVWVLVDTEDGKILADEVVAVDSSDEVARAAARSVQAFDVQTEHNIEGVRLTWSDDARAHGIRLRTKLRLFGFETVETVTPEDARTNRNKTARHIAPHLALAYGAARTNAADLDSRYGVFRRLAARVPLRIAGAASAVAAVGVGVLLYSLMGGSSSQPDATVAEAIAPGGVQATSEPVVAPPAPQAVAAPAVNPVPSRGPVTFWRPATATATTPEWTYQPDEATVPDVATVPEVTTVQDTSTVPDPDSTVPVAVSTGEGAAGQPHLPGPAVTAGSDVAPAVGLGTEPVTDTPTGAVTGLATGAATSPGTESTPAPLVAPVLPGPSVPIVSNILQALP